MGERRFICANPDCDFHKKEEFLSNQRDCYECGKPLIEKSRTVKFSNQEIDIVNNYPYIIALPFFEFLNETHLHSRVTLLKDIFESSLRYIALLSLSEYFNSTHKSSKINESFGKNITDNQTIGSLGRFISDSLSELKKIDHTFFIKELLNFYEASINEKGEGIKNREIIINKGVTDKFGKKSNITSVKTDFNILRVEFRNKMIGHGPKWSDSISQEILDTYYPILLDFIETMSFVKNYPMLKWEKGNSYDLMGYKVEINSNEKELENKNLLWLKNSTGNNFSLAPLFVLPKQYVSEVKEHIQLFYYLDFTGTIMILLSPEKEIGITDGNIVRLLNDIIKEKDDTQLFTEETLTYKGFLEGVKKQEYEEKRNLKSKNPSFFSLYIRRLEAEIAWKSYIESSFGLFVISARAGTGKSSLLFSIHKELVVFAKKRKVNTKKAQSLILSANRFSTANVENEIKRYLNLTSDFDLFYLKTVFSYSQSEPFIILIDGGNEHNEPEKLIGELMKFLQKYSGGFIKIILTWRADSKSELPKISPHFEKYIYSDQDDTNQENVLAKKAYVLHPLNKVELSDVWNKHVNHKSKLYSPKFSLEEITAYDRAFVEKLNNPLHLKLFLELYNGRKLPKSNGFLNFWEEWVKQFKNDNGEYELLLSLIDLMYIHQTNRVPSRIYFLDTKFKKHLSYDIIGPFEQLKRKGVITESHLNNERYLSFTLESFYHYLLGEYLFLKYKEEPPSTLLQLLKGNKLKGISNGIQQVLIKDINSHNYTRLNWLIDNSEEESLHWFSLPLAHAFLMYDVKFVFEKLFKIQSNNNVQVLSYAIQLLEKTQQLELVKTVYLIANKILIANDYNSVLIKIFAIEFNYSSLYVKRLEKLEVEMNKFSLTDNQLANCNNHLGLIYESKNNYKSALKFYKRSLALYIKVNGGNSSSSSVIFLNIGKMYRIQNEFEQALNFYQKSLDINLSLFGDLNSNVATVYNNIAVVYHVQNDFKNALKYYNKSKNINLKLLGEYHPKVANDFNNIGLLNQDLGKFDEALKLIKKSLVINLNVHGEVNEKVAKNYNDISVVYSSQEKFNEALKLMKKSLSIYLKIHGYESPFVAKNYENIGSLYSYLGKSKNSLDFYQKSLAINLKIFGAGHSSVSNDYKSIAWGEFYRSNHELALSFNKKSLVINLKLFGKEHLTIVNNYILNATIYSAQEKYNDAIDSFQKSLSIQLSIHGEKYINNLEIYIDLANLTRKVQDYLMSVKYLKLYWENIPKKKGGTAYEIYTCYKKLNQPKGAIHWLEECALMRKKQLGEEDDRTQNTIKELVDYAKELGKLEMVKKWESEINKN